MNGIRMALLGASALASLRTFAPEGGSGGGDGKPGIDPSRLDLSIGGGDTDTLDVGGKPTTKKSDGVSVDIDRSTGEAKQNGIGDAPAEDAKDADGGEDEEGSTDPEEKKAEGDDTGGDEPYAPLPDYSEETHAEYEERFIKSADDGDELNIDAIADEIRANMAKAEGATERPNEGTYKFLKAKMGLTKAVIDDVIEAKKAQAIEITKAFDEVTGGKEVWDAKLAWAGSTTDKDGKVIPGAYTKAQIDAYNAGMTAGGERAAEQIELMNARFAKANPDFKGTTPAAKVGEATQPPTTIGIKRRAASPKASTTTGATNTGGNGGGAKPYADAKEHREALAAIRSLPQVEQEPEHQKVRARLRVSPWYKAQQKG